jgi:glycosyltransferase involved in cell wall biosynthesis
MRIVVAHNYYQQPGGEDACVAAEMAMLEAHGHEVVLFALDNDAIEGIGRLDLAVRTVWSRPAAVALERRLRQHRAQIVHFHNTFPLLSPAAYYAARRAGAAVVQTLHNFRICCPNALLFRDGAPCESCLGRSFAWPGVLRKCYRGSRLATVAAATTSSLHKLIGTWSRCIDVYVALSCFSRARLIQGGLPAARIAVKPNFVFPDPGAGTGTGSAAVFVGRLSHEKGLDVVLAAWRRLDCNMRLQIIGDGPLSGMVTAAAQANPSIQWLGRMPPERVYDRLGEAAFCIVSSQCYENFPRVIVEAFAKGTPVIASRLGGMAEIVEHGRNGLLFAPGDAAGLAHDVSRLASDPFWLARMRRAARQDYEERYTARANHDMLTAIYSAAIERAMPSAAAAKTLMAEQQDGRRRG